MEDEPTLEYITKNIAGIKQQYTQKGGVRPFGVSCFLGGFSGSTPKLYQTEPSGAFNEWKANAIGRNASTLREYLEKHYEGDSDIQKTTKLGIETLMEVVENPANIEICIIKQNKIEMMEQDKLNELYEVIKKEKQETEDAKKNKKGLEK